MATMLELYQKEERERILEFNMKEVVTAFHAVANTEPDEDVKAFVADWPRIGKVRLCTFEQASSVIGATLLGTRSNETNFVALVKEEKAVFPTAYFYYPALSERVAVKQTVRKLRSTFRNEGLQMPLELERQILSEGVIAPGKILFDGCKARFDNLKNKPGAILITGDIIQHIIREETYWTIFSPDYNYREAFTKKIIAVTGGEVPQFLAEEISEKWDHRVYASIYPTVFRDPNQYATKMAIGSPDDVAKPCKDILQGEVTELSFHGKRFVNIDITKPSAILLGGKLNIYIPKDYEG